MNVTTKDMSDSEFFEALSNIRYKAPDWMISTTIDEQIQYQVKSALRESKEPRAIMVFTYDMNREPKLRKQIIEI